MLTRFIRSAPAWGLACIVTLVASHAPVQAQTESAGEEAPADIVVAMVNGDPIYRSEVQELFQQVPPQFQQYGIGFLYERLVNQLIAFKLLAEEGRAQGLASDPEVMQELDRIQDVIIRQIYMTRLVEESVTEERLMAAYEEYKQANPPAEETRARHILVETEERANELLAMAQGGGDFAELAREYSTGPSAAQGGDLGYFGQGAMVKEFQDAADALAVGEVSSTPVKTQFGWHIIKVEDRRVSEPPSLEELRGQLTSQLRQQIVSELFESRIAKAEVQRFDFEGNPIAEEAPAPAGAGAEQPATTE